MATRPDDAILSLPIDERLALVDSIWESIRENADTLPVDDQTLVEMRHRLDLHRDGSAAADDLDVVLARLRAKDWRFEFGSRPLREKTVKDPADDC